MKIKFQMLKFRAECYNDVEILIRKVMKKFFITKIVIEQSELQDFWISDRIVTIKTNATIAEIKNICSEIVDIHVILETIETKENYTGIRKLNEK